MVLARTNRRYHVLTRAPGALVVRSPGTGTTKGAWDAIRYTTSADGASWSSPEVALTTSNLYNYNSVCDPSVVRFRGVYYMYHTCINTVNPPDGYKNNRCVARACIIVLDALCLTLATVLGVSAASVSRCQIPSVDRGATTRRP